VRSGSHDFDGPAEFLEAMRDCDITRKHKNWLRPTLSSCIDDGTHRRRRNGVFRPKPAPRRAASGAGAGRRSGRQELCTAAARRRRADLSKIPGQMHSTDYRVPEKYLDRAIRELQPR